MVTGLYTLDIGKTSYPLRARVRVHKQQINIPENRQISSNEHLDVCGQGQFNIFPFCKFWGDLSDM